MLDLLAEIGKLRTEKAELKAEVARMREYIKADRADVVRLEAAVAEWKERWQAEHDDHLRTIEHFDKVMNEGP